MDAFWKYVEATYPEDIQLIIEDLVAYKINKYNGFDKQNDPIIYADNMRADPSGELQRLAMMGANLEIDAVWKHRRRGKHH